LYLITEDFVKFLHVCSIQTMKAESFQFILLTTIYVEYCTLSKRNSAKRHGR